MVLLFPPWGCCDCKAKAAGRTKGVRGGCKIWGVWVRGAARAPPPVVVAVVGVVVVDCSGASTGEREACFKIAISLAMSSLIRELELDRSLKVIEAASLSSFLPSFTVLLEELLLPLISLSFCSKYSRYTLPFWR